MELGLGLFLEDGEMLKPGEAEKAEKSEITLLDPDGEGLGEVPLLPLLLLVEVEGMIVVVVVLP